MILLRTPLDQRKKRGWEGYIALGGPCKQIREEENDTKSVALPSMIIF